LSAAVQGRREKAANAGTKKTVAEWLEKPALCIVDKGAVRSAAHFGGKWLASMSLGEEVNWLGEIDSISGKPDIYLKVRLSDGIAGWVSMRTLVIGGSPAVAIRDINVYKQPDLLKTAGERFAPFDFVAIIAREEDWLKVQGEMKRKNGWIQDGNVSRSAEDIAIALLVRRALAMQDKQAAREQLETIIANPDFEKSLFYAQIQSKLASLPIAAEATTPSMHAKTGGQK
jgi:hypothetical protein